MFQFAISRCAFKIWIIWGIFFWLIVPDFASTDNFRPAYLEVEELASGNIRVVWKVPIGQGLSPQLQPSFPEQFRIIPPRKRLKTNDAVVDSWNMIGDEKGLAGVRIRINGLEQTTTDVLVRIRLSNGSVHRVVLRPTENFTTIPDRNNTETESERVHTTVLRFLNHWRYGLLLSAAFILSLLPGARGRGIILCAVALIAGAIGGQALGRLPVYDNVFNQNVPSKAQAAKILQGLMLNTYRAFMLQRDEDIYDTLARSVSGDFLSEVYLQNREKLRMDDSDGNMAVIHRLDIKSIDAMTPNKDGSIGIVADWDVYGSVHHRKHVHYRCNTYTAEVTIKPTDEYWKLVKIQLLDEQRVL